MNDSLEIRALVVALVVGALSLSGTWLLAEVIQRLPDSVIGPEPAPLVAISTAPDIIQQGSDAYQMSCTECHGDDAHGDEGPDLYNLPISNAHIAKAIRVGIKGEMPSFSKQYDEAQIAAIVSYLRSLK